MVYTAKELEIWEQGYNKGYEMGSSVGKMAVRLGREGYQPTSRRYEASGDGVSVQQIERALDLAISKAPRRIQPKRKLSAWNKYVKANSKKPRFRYRNGKLNLKKMAVAFRKTPAGKKKRR